MLKGSGFRLDFESLAGALLLVGLTLVPFLLLSVAIRFTTSRLFDLQLLAFLPLMYGLAVALLAWRIWGASLLGTIAVLAFVAINFVIFVGVRSRLRSHIWVLGVRPGDRVSLANIITRVLSQPTANVEDLGRNAAVFVGCIIGRPDQRSGILAIRCRPSLNDDEWLSLSEALKKIDNGTAIRVTHAFANLLIVLTLLWILAGSLLTIFLFAF
jgi:hypothetical protein